MEGMSKEAIWQMVQQLQAGLQAREKQLERQGQQLANMQEVQHHLQVRPHALTYTLVQGRGERKRAGGEELCQKRPACERHHQGQVRLNSHMRS